MIKFENDTFYLETKDTNYIFLINQYKQLEQVYYGPKIILNDIKNIIERKSIRGTTEYYDNQNKKSSLSNLLSEISFIGRSDYQHSYLSIENSDTSLINDFKYVSHDIYQDLPKNDNLAHFHDNNNQTLTLEICLEDEKRNLNLILFYSVLFEANVIVKSSKLINNSEDPVFINKLMSNQLDLSNDNFKLITFDGSWAKERHKHEKILTEGLYINDSLTGNSSNRHNPFVILANEDCQQQIGLCYGFNLIYSGNHMTSVELNNVNNIRVLSGINCTNFKWELLPNESFSTPEAVLSVSDQGYNQLSLNMHKFINEHIINPNFKNKPRPILVNSWEAAYFNFNENTLLNMAKTSKELGIELFVLDDGWFKNRNSDSTSLGDWSTDLKKLPSDLKGLAEKINKIGLKFGLWVEPEMISANSDLYRLHPEYAIKHPYYQPIEGRNQFVLDLCNQEVCDYIISSMSKIFSSANIEYVKWDMNRNITDMYSPAIKNQQEFNHRYILGLYQILNALTSKFDNILFESCASGGNRFDLGMLCFMPQIWVSDDTDAYERLKIVEGTSYGYPLSVMGAHISNCPNHQTLRNIDLESRFNVNCFGLLGYELDVTKLSQIEKSIIKQQISYYKENRELFQFGNFYRLEDGFKKEHRFMVISQDKEEAIIGYFQGLIKPNQANEILKTKYLANEYLYEVNNRKQKLNIKTFGDLINHQLPIKVNKDGILVHLAQKHYALDIEQEHWLEYGLTLNKAGLKIAPQFVGVDYDSSTRVMLDFGSRLYKIKKKID